MASTAAKLVYIAIAFAIVGSLVLLIGSFLPIPPLFVLILGYLCFGVVIVTVIFALYYNQRESVKTQVHVSV